MSRRRICAPESTNARGQTKQPPNIKAKSVSLHTQLTDNIAIASPPTWSPQIVFTVEAMSSPAPGVYVLRYCVIPSPPSPDVKVATELAGYGNPIGLAELNPEPEKKQHVRLSMVSPNSHRGC